MNLTQISRVAVQIVTYNNDKTIEACLDSLRRQRFTQFQLVVIDNASSDNTKKILEKNAIRFIANRKNKGYAAGHNQALRYSRSQYVLTLNPDVVLDERLLDCLVRALDIAGTRVGSVQALLLRTERMGEKSDYIDSAGLSLSPARRQILLYEGQRRSVFPKTPALIFGPDGAAALYRRAMLRDIDTGNGVFDEDFFMHKEDVDVCWRAQLRGWSALFVPDAVGYHIRSFRPGRRKAMSPAVRMLAVRNRYFLLIKNELLVLFLRDFVWIVLYDLIIFSYIVLFERSSFRAYASVLHSLPKLYMKRRAIQKNRCVGVGYMSQWFRWRAV